MTERDKMEEQTEVSGVDEGKDDNVLQQQQGEQEPNTNGAVKKLIQLYVSPEESQQILEKEMEVLECNIQALLAREEYCNDVYETHAMTLNVRSTLIDNGYGSLTEEMIDNQEEWDDYMVHLETAFEHVETGLNCLLLLRAECKSISRALTTFWVLKKDLDSGARRFDTGEYLQLAAEIVFKLFPRRQFLARSHNKQFASYKVLFEQEPDWLEWDVIPSN